MSKIIIKKSVLDDIQYLRKWLSESDTSRWYPMCNEREVEDAARFWISFVKYKAVLTAYYNGEVAGIVNLYLQTYQKLKHQSLLAIIVKSDLRGKGIGSMLLKEIEKLAKDQFNIKFLHLEVYEGNPAIKLYERHGFVKYGKHPNFIKNLDGSYMSKTFMQKKI